MNVPSNAIPESIINVDNVVDTKISEKKFQVIFLLRKIKQVPIVSFCYQGIAKPPYQFMKRILLAMK
jgi:hypothetical protein